MAEDHDQLLPMPWQRLRLFLGVWHVLYLGGLVAMLLLAVWQDGAAHPGQVTVLGICVLLQVLLYVTLVMRQEQWPLPGPQALLYFAASAVLWAVQWELDLRFLWVGWALVGQMFGLLRPRFAIPSSAVVAFYFFARINNWAVAAISFGEVIAWFSTVVLFLYIYGLNRASLDRSLLVAELQAAQRELHALRDQDVELAALRERERLARDLHDGLGHTLVALSVQLEAIQRLYRVDPARASAQIDVTKDLVRASMEELRRSLAGLRAAGLAGQSLSAALAALGAAFQARSATAVACTVQGDANDLPPAVSDALWRVIQEALTNVEKHAQAQQVEIALDIMPSAVRLHVCDDGVGLPVQRSPGAVGAHFGLAGMRERVEGVGGQLEVASGRPRGTCVTVTVPLRRQPHEDARPGDLQTSDT